MSLNHLLLSFLKLLEHWNSTLYSLYTAASPNVLTSYFYKWFVNSICFHIHHVWIIFIFRVYAKVIRQNQFSDCWHWSYSGVSRCPTLPINSTFRQITNGCTLTTTHLNYRSYYPTYQLCCHVLFFKINNINYVQPVFWNCLNIFYVVSLCEQFLSIFDKYSGVFLVLTILFQCMTQFRIHFNDKHSHYLYITVTIPINNQYLNNM